MTKNSDVLKDTIALPQTEFPMRAGLPKKEPAILEQWWDKSHDGDLYKQAMNKMKECETFMLHWGPPFANGHMHMGHALTYILKDTIIRSQMGLGKRAPSVTGWDCHGLPIEWKVEEEYRKQGKNKDEVSTLEFREECRQYAKKWKNIQAQEMKRFGIFADWENPYLTMDNESEAAIANEVLSFVKKDLIYSALRPVSWSVVEKTALAEAEIEYKEHKSTTIYVAFPVVEASHDLVKDAHMVIWTTTPWTIPANRLIGAHEELEYSVFEVTSLIEEAKLQQPLGKKLVIASNLAETFKTHIGVDEWTLIGTLKGADLIGTVTDHPFAKEHDYYTRGSRVVHGDFVTADAGTGLVHIAPSHGKDDFMLGRENGVEAENTVLDDGTYHPEVGLFAGLDVYNEKGKEGAANGAVIKKLFETGYLMGKSSMRHEYPHSWRSKSPLIFRATAQWYVDLDNSGLRKKALKSIDETQWFPATSKNRIQSMVEGRPDWCISRQRVWGVPIAIFTNKISGEILNDEDVHNRIIEIFEKEGADAWYGRDPQDFLGDKYKAEEYTQVRDVIDVWFESGSTHAFVCEKRPDLKWPADLYLEGSDQHRGWFQSSLLESCGTRDRAPYDQVLTHGFILDSKGYKMSKSLGNVMDPLKICDQYGADIMRLWVVNADFSEDVRIGDEVLKHQADLYRRLRNCLRFLLGNMNDLTADELVDINSPEMPELERYVLHRLSEMDSFVRESYKKYELNKLFSKLQNFCTLELSALYFDIRKDMLYCDNKTSFERRAARTVLAKIFECLVTWLAPVLVFTTEEAWSLRPAGIFEQEDGSVHLRQFPQIPTSWRDDALAVKWKRIAEIRDVVLGALEIERANKNIGSSLQAHPTIYVQDPQDIAWLNSVHLADVCITSTAEVIEGAAPDDAFTLEDVQAVGVVASLAKGHKCERCWKVLEEVSEGGLCNRCEDAVSSLDKAAA